MTGPRRLLLAAIGLALMFLCAWIADSSGGLWLPSVGVGLALVAWLGQPIVPLLIIAMGLGRLAAGGDQTAEQALVSSALLGFEISLSWWVYAGLAKGSRRLDDPRSATVFLILVPGAIAAALASLEALHLGWSAQRTDAFWTLAGGLWIARALGVLVLTPLLLAVLTPLFVRHGFAHPESTTRLPGGHEPEDWTWGEFIETAGLCLAAGILAIALVYLFVERHVPNWSLWGFSLLLVVWGALRQGLRGGALVAGASAIVALGYAQALHVGPFEFSPLQGNLLAQCSVALLVGASAGWIRASEARYRQMVGHIPVVLYSVRLPRALEVPAEANHAMEQPHPKTGLPSGWTIVKRAEVVLVSPACQTVLDCPPEQLLGAYAAWLERIEPADRELVIAALSQLCLQKQPVTCEYRVAAAKTSSHQGPRWVRDTLVPTHHAEETLDGWEGVIEDITERRALGQDVRRSNGMLQALVTYLPTGVYFVQGPIGQPVLVNQRARQLLGQREDLSAGITHLSEAYRLFRPDGSIYPTDELPVAKALRLGTTSMANDIVVHRPDGRRVPLITWAAPVDWTGMGNPDAAVWVLEDLTALQQAETARRESEARLRGVFESMAEGVIVQNQTGTILECNPAACTILGLTHDHLLGRRALGPENGCIREDGTPMPRAEQPDALALRGGVAVRNVVMGVPLTTSGNTAPALRWIFVNSMPLPVGTSMTPNTKGARLVTTFADITAQRQALEELRRAQRLELVGRLAGGTVHDFNNFLTVMIGLAGLVQRGLPADHPALPDLARLVEAGEQAAHLAGQLLAFSKQKKPTIHGVDLNTIIVHTSKLIKGSLPPGIQVEHQLQGDVLLVNGDETQLKQVVMNLCLNARDAMDKGGTITVGTAAAAGQSATGKRLVKLTVADTGHGIPPEMQERIFEPFFSTKEHGTGLGLAVVRQIVEGLGGRITVTSQPGNGTCMEVLLPAYEPTSVVYTFQKSPTTP